MSANRDQIADYLLTHVGGDESDPWQAGHNYAMREAARLVREKWDEIPAPSVPPTTADDDCPDRRSR